MAEQQMQSICDQAMDMQRRENYLCIGMDLHRDTHTAVLANCWNEKLDAIVIENKPSEFIKLAKKVDKAAIRLNLSPIYDLENAYGYGRSLAVWLIEKGYAVKDVNPSMVYEQRKSAPMMKKNNEPGAYCVATVLINQPHTPCPMPSRRIATGHCHSLSTAGTPL